MLHLEACEGPVASKMERKESIQGSASWFQLFAQKYLTGEQFFKKAPKTIKKPSSLKTRFGAMI